MPTLPTIEVKPLGQKIVTGLLVFIAVAVVFNLAVIFFRGSGPNEVVYKETIQRLQKIIDSERVERSSLYAAIKERDSLSNHILLQYKAMQEHVDDLTRYIHGLDKQYDKISIDINALTSDSLLRAYSSFR